MPYLSKKEYCSVFPGIPMKEITLPDGTTSKRAVDINGNTLSAADTYKLWNKEYKKWEKECKTKKSPKRRSTKRKSPKRKSPKRKSPKRRSTKRKSPKRKSPKRKSPRRASPIRKMRKYYPTFVGKRFQKFERPSSMPRYAAPGPAPAAPGPAPAPGADKISAKGFNLTRIEHDIMNLRVKADKYMYLAIVNMDIELYNVAVYHGGVFPKASVTFLAIDDFIRDMKNLRLIKDSVIGGWKNVDYVLLEKVLKSFSEKDLYDYWFNPRYSEAYMTFALGQEEKTAVEWLLKNNKYTNEQLDLFSQLPWVKPEFKEMLKPKSFIGGALSVLTGGFFF